MGSAEDYRRRRDATAMGPLARTGVLRRMRSTSARRPDITSTAVRVSKNLHPVSGNEARSHTCVTHRLPTARIPDRAKHSVANSTMAVVAVFTGGCGVTPANTARTSPATRIGRSGPYSSLRPRSLKLAQSPQRHKSIQHISTGYAWTNQTIELRRWLSEGTT